jgi:hypothetical protein
MSAIFCFDQYAWRHGRLARRRFDVLTSVLEAVKLGQWDFEPREVDSRNYSRTRAMPGTREKLTVMAERLRLGLPLWHPCDRRSWDDEEDDA